MRNLRPVPIRSKRMTDYWLKFYVNNHLCSLCGNSGVIDTTGIKSAAGVSVGRKNFCICPNGQAIRKGCIDSTGNMDVLPDDITDGE